MELHKLNDAAEDLKMAVKISPKDKAIRAEYENLR